MPPLFKSANPALKISEPRVFRQKFLSPLTETHAVRVYMYGSLQNLFRRNLKPWSMRLQIVCVRLNAWGGEDGGGRIKSEFLVDKSGRRARFRITTPKTRTHKCVHIRSPAMRSAKNDSILSAAEWRVGERKILMRERPRKTQPKVTTKFPSPLFSRYLRKCSAHKKKFFSTQSHFGWWWRGRFMRPFAIFPYDFGERPRSGLV